MSDDWQAVKKEGAEREGVKRQRPGKLRAKAFDRNDVDEKLVRNEKSNFVQSKRIF